MSVAARRGGRFVRRLAHRLSRAARDQRRRSGRRSSSPATRTGPTRSTTSRRLWPEFEELHGDRLYGDDPAIVAGIGRGVGGPGGRHRAPEGARHGRPHLPQLRHARPGGLPQGHAGDGPRRQARPAADHADRHAGGLPGRGAEERGQGGAIARSMQTMLRLRVPSIAVVIGEGSSGGALALGVADRVMMLENSTYSVISPEGGAAILWRDAGKRARRRRGVPADGRQLLPLGHRRRRGARARRRGPPRPRRGGAPAGRLHHARPARPARPAAGRAPAAAARALPAHRRLPRGGRGRPGRDRGRAGSTPRPTARPGRRSARGGASAPGGLAEGGHQLALEGRDVGHHAAPDQLAVAEGRLVHPLRAGEDEVVLDAERAGGARRRRSRPRSPRCRRGR